MSATTTKTQPNGVPQTRAQAKGSLSTRRRMPPVEKTHISDDDAFAAYLREVTSLNRDLLTPAQERALAVRVQAGDREARTQFIEANVRLVMSVARKYVGSGLELLDLVQEGNIGLMKAVDRYDPENGARFSTYALWWIHQAIIRAVVEDGGPIHVPTWVQTEVRKVRMCRKRYLQTLGREPRMEELTQETGMDAARIQELLQVVRPVASLEAEKYGEDAELSLGSMLADEAEPVEDEAVRAVGDCEMESALRRLLSPREFRVVQLHYGLFGREQTLEEVGQRLGGLSKERVRQIKVEALAKLRAASATLFFGREVTQEVQL